MEITELGKKDTFYFSTRLIEIHFFGATLFLVTSVFLQIVIGSYPSFPWINLFVFFILCFSTIFSPFLSLKLLVFLLPFTAGISEQIKAIFNFDIFTVGFLSVDASIGWILGFFLLYIFKKDKFHAETISSKIRLFELLLLGFNLLIFVTGCIAISRNLYQAASPYSVKGFFYNLANLRIISWHDDYFPLTDLFIFTTAITLSLRLLTLVRTRAQLMGSVLYPLFTATVILLSYALWSRFTGIGYFRDGVQYGANSFLPDIHAFGGYALAAFVGGFYYFTCSPERVKRPAGGFSFLAAAAVIASGSRFSIVVLFIILLVYLSFLILKNSRKNWLTLILIATTIIFASILLYRLGDRGLIHSLTLAIQAKSFEDINVALSYRPEIFHSSLLMYSDYPILGLGKGIFYRQSSIKEFSQSFFFTGFNNGENAHNYFIQILSETGLIGFSLFCAIFIYQAVYLKNRHNQILTVWIFGIFLGNIYGHSLLISNILLLLFILLGATNVEIDDDSNLLKTFLLNRSLSWRYLSIIVVTLLIIGAVHEVNTSYGKLPFQQRFACYKKEYYSDNHTDGLFEENYKINGQNIKIEYTVYHPDAQRRPLTLDFNLYQERKKIANYSRTIQLPGQYEDSFDISGMTPGSNILLQIKTSRCFTPINLGFNLDKRRLGIQLNRVSQN
jgi:O-antigen ligase